MRTVKRARCCAAVTRSTMSKQPPSLEVRAEPEEAQRRLSTTGSGVRDAGALDSRSNSYSRRRSRIISSLCLSVLNASISAQNRNIRPTPQSPATSRLCSRRKLVSGRKSRTISQLYQHKRGHKRGDSPRVSYPARREQPIYSHQFDELQETRKHAGCPPFLSPFSTASAAAAWPPADADDGSPAQKRTRTSAAPVQTRRGRISSCRWEACRRE